MTIGVVSSLRNAWVQGIADAINGGSGPGQLRFYNGTRPATGGAATTLLGTVLCSDPCQASIANGVLTFSPFTDDESADATGTATWARFTDSAGTTVCDCSVGTSGADINLNSVAITTGGIIRVNSGTLTAGNP